MNIADFVEALDLPASTRVDRRIPKKLLMEQGASTAVDKRRIGEGIDQVDWLAALKPTTVGVPIYRDDGREYLEIAILSALFRANRFGGRLIEMIHRAIPYPTMLIAQEASSLSLSMAHKRWSQGETGATVLDGPVYVGRLTAASDSEFLPQFIEATSLSRQPRDDLFVLYQGWIDTMIALVAARATGVFTIDLSPARADARRAALADRTRLEAQLAKVRAAAKKERQVARKVALNAELKRLKEEISAAGSNL